MSVFSRVCFICIQFQHISCTWEPKPENCSVHVVQKFFLTYFAFNGFHCICIKLASPWHTNLSKLLSEYIRQSPTCNFFLSPDNTPLNQTLSYRKASRSFPTPFRESFSTPPGRKEHGWNVFCRSNFLCWNAVCQVSESTACSPQSFSVFLCGLVFHCVAVLCNIFFRHIVNLRFPLQ